MNPSLTPPQAGALFAGATAVLLLLFLLRRRSQRVVVPSLDPWREAVRRRVNPIWRELLALALQVLVVAAIALALVQPDDARPEAEVEAEAGWIAVIDGSASMGALGRLQEALGEARRRDVPVLLAGREPVLLVEPGASSAARAAGERRAQASLGGESVGRGVALARAMGLRPLVLSDHPGEAPPGGAWEVVGTGTHDVAVESVVATAGPGLPPEYAVTARVVNHAPEPKRVFLQLESAEGVLGGEDVELPPGTAVERTWRMEPVEGAWIAAALEDHSDGFDFNDVAYGLLPGLRPAEVRLVSDGNRYLEEMLGVMPGLRLRRVSPDAWRPPAEPVDLVIFDRVAPRGQAAGAAAAVVYLDPPEGAGPLPATSALDAPVFTTWDFSHPVLRGVALRQLTVDRASVLRVGPEARVLAATDQGPVIAALDGAPRSLVVGFDLTRSDLPLTIAFPQLVYNLVMWARQDAVGAAPPPSMFAGEALSVSPAGPVGVTRLDRGGEATWPPGTWALTELEPGVYRVLDADGERLVAVSADPSEHGVALGVDPSTQGGEDTPLSPDAPPRYAWLLLAAAAMALVEFAVAPR